MFHYLPPPTHRTHSSPAIDHTIAEKEREKVVNQPITMSFTTIKPEAG